MYDCIVYFKSGGFSMNRCRLGETGLGRFLFDLPLQVNVVHSECEVFIQSRFKFIMSPILVGASSAKQRRWINA